MALIRFVAPTRDLQLPGVPATFDNFVCDVPDTDLARLARMRYLGAPYGVREEGATIGSGQGWPTKDDIAADILNPATSIGSSLATRIHDEDLPLETAVTRLRTDVDDLRASGGGIQVLTTLPTSVAPGDLVAILRTY